MDKTCYNCKFKSTCSIKSTDIITIDDKKVWVKLINCNKWKEEKNV